MPYRNQEKKSNFVRKKQKGFLPHVLLEYLKNNLGKINQRLHKLT